MHYKFLGENGIKHGFILTISSPWEVKKLSLLKNHSSVTIYKYNRK